MKKSNKNMTLKERSQNLLWLILVALFFINLSSNSLSAQESGHSFVCGTGHVHATDVNDPKFVEFKKNKLLELQGESGSGDLSVLINFHIMQTTDVDPGESFTNEPDQLQYLCGIVTYLNSQTFNNAGLLESCGDLLSCHPFSEEEPIPGTEMLDPGIEMILNKVVFHQDPTGLNANCGGSYFNNTYLQDNNGNPDPEFCDAINVFFTESSSGPSGCGFSSTGIVTMNNVFAQHFPANAPWDICGTLAHEIGHVLELDHPFSKVNNDTERPHNPNASPSDHLCTQEDTDGSGGQRNPCALTGCWRGGSNLVMGYGRIKRYLTPDGIAIMQNNLCNGTQNKFVDPTPCETVTFTSDHTIEEDEVEYYCGDIVVANGATLTVKGNLFMRGSWNPGYKGITVKSGGKLFIDGGLVRSCGGWWRGIVIEDFGSGEVKIRNGGTVEFARFGITKNEAGGSANGLIDISNGVFRDCRVGIGFVGHSSDPTDDDSQIHDCKFLKNRRDIFYGITMYKIVLSSFVNAEFDGQENDGILAATSTLRCSGSDFRNIGEAGISLDNSRVILYNSDFTNMPVGILIDNENADFFGSVIGNSPEKIGNRFDVSDYGIQIKTDVNKGRTSIQDNDFLGGEIGVKIENEAFFSVNRNNFFDLEKGVEVNNSGSIITSSFSSQKFVISNHFKTGTQEIGVHCLGANPQLFIVKNCFQSSDTDILIEGSGIRSRLGINTDGAGNCFTKSGTVGINNASSQSLEYWESDDEWCLSPDIVLGNVTLEQADETDPIPCNIAWFPAPPDDPEFCDCDFFFLTDKSSSVDTTEFNEMECAIKETISEIDSLCGGDCKVRFGSGSFTGHSPVLDNEFQCDSLESIGPDRSGGTNIASGLCGLLTWLDSGAVDPALEEGEEYDPECLKIIMHTDAGCGNFDDVVNCGGKKLTVNDLIDSLEINYGADISIVHYTNYDDDGNPINPLEDCEDASNAASDSTGVIIESEFDCEGNASDIIDSLRIANDIQYLKVLGQYKHIDNGLEGDVALTANLRDQGRLRISPNPFNTVLNIEFDRQSEYEIVIMNNLGQRVYSEIIVEKDQQTIDAALWTPGIYFVHCYDKVNDLTWTKKVIMTKR